MYFLQKAALKRLCPNARSASFGTLVAICLMSLPVTIALAAPPLTKAPANVDFTNRQKTPVVMSGNQLDTGPKQGRGTGFVPSPRSHDHLKGVNLQQAQEAAKKSALKLAPLSSGTVSSTSGTTTSTVSATTSSSSIDWTPSLATYGAQYDARTAGKVSPVKDQGGCGSCWTFATMASAEAAPLPGVLEDFSENNLKNKAGFDLGACSGGNADMSTAYLARWSGLVREADDPYQQANSISPAATASYHLQEVLVIPGKSSPLDLANIKSAVTSFGTVYTTMNWVDSSYNALTNSFYYAGTGSNHAVAIVGWDDNYSRTNFKTVPPGDGAYLVKNSWGTGFGQSGYFWTSYYDSIMGTSLIAFSGVESPVNFSSIYQYDPLGATTDIGYGSNTAWAANIFSATSTEEISAVSFYTPAVNTGYEIYLYAGVTAGQPRSGTLVSTKTGTIVTPGYHTVLMDSPMPVSNGQRFSVVIKLTTPGYNYPIAIEYPFAGYSSKATAATGQGYIGYDGAAWSDMASTYANTSVCIKAFGSQTGPSIALTATPGASAKVGDTVTLEATASGSYDYQFLAQDSTGAWHTLQTFSSTNTASWNTTGYPSGPTTIRVQLRNAGTTPPGGYDYRQDLNYQLQPVGPATGLTVKVDKTSPQRVGTLLNITASGSGGSGVYEYQFYALYGSSQILLRDWSSSASYSWDTAGKPSGTWYIMARVRAAGSAPALGYDKSTAIPYSLSPLPASTGVTITTATTRVASGTKVTLTAQGSGGTGSYEYAFMATTPGSSTASVVQGWSTTNTYLWDTANIAAGNYYFTVRVRTAGSAPATGFDKAASLGLYTARVLVGAITVSPAQTGAVTTKFTLGASGLGGSGNYEFAFYEKAPGSTVAVLARDWGSSSYTWDSAYKAAGSWEVSAAVREAGTSSSADVLGKVITLSALAKTTGVTITPSAVRVPTGATATFTAKAAGGTGTYEYAFYKTAPGGAATLVQAWSTNAVYSWNTSGATTGGYQVMVKARTAGTAPTTGYDATASTTVYTANVVINSFSMSPTGTVPVTTKIALTAAATGGSGNYQYAFAEKGPGATSWTVVGSWGNSASFTWDSTGKIAGIWELAAWVRESGTSDSAGATDALSGKITLSALAKATGVSVTPSLARAATGSKVDITAQGKGGTGAYEYAFFETAPSGTATLIRGWGTGATYTWDTSSATPGSYLFTVRVRTAGTAPVTGFDASAGVSVYTAKTVVASFSAAPAGTAQVSSKIALTATAAGTSGNYEYTFSAKPSTSGTWTTLQGWSSAASCTWDTAGLVAGTWNIMVSVRDTGSSSAADAVSTNYTLTALPKSTGVSVTPSLAKIAIGTTVTVTAAGTGGTGSYEYAFFQTAPGGSAVLVRGWSSSNSFSWNSSNAAVGNWVFTARVRTAGSSPTTGYDTAASTSVYAAKSIVASFATQVSSLVTSSAQVNSKITLTASGSGGSGSYQYAFYAKAPGSTSWVQVSGWGSSNSYVWDSYGKTVGTWELSAWIRQSGTLDSAGKDDSSSIRFTLTALPVSTGVTLTPSAYSVTKGGALTLTAKGAGGTGTYEYAFFQTAPGGTPVLARGWSTDGNLAVDTSAKALGNWSFQVRARTAGSAPATGFDVAATTVVAIK